jgi:hypothetical protein
VRVWAMTPNMLFGHEDSSNMIGNAGSTSKGGASRTAKQLLRHRSRRRVLPLRAIRGYGSALSKAVSLTASGFVAQTGRVARRKHPSAASRTGSLRV